MDTIGIHANHMDIKTSSFEIANLHEKMKMKQIRNKRLQMFGRFLGNLVVAAVLLLPLLYAVSIAFMPSSELFTMEFNLMPKQPTMKNFREAISKVPLLKFVFNSFVVAGMITLGQIVSCSLAAFSFMVHEPKEIIEWASEMSFTSSDFI